MPMNKRQHEFNDRFGRFFEANGLPRSAGRVLAHLLTTLPAEQTFDDIVAALGASRSTISVATQLLVRIELVERFGVPNDRRDRYRIRGDAWTMLLRQDVAAATQLAALAEDGLDVIRSQPASARKRLEALRSFARFLEDAYAPILARWEKLQGDKR